MDEARGGEGFSYRHPDGQVIVFTVKAHRSTLTAYVPTPVQVRGTDDPDELALSWSLTGPPSPGR
jgi:hypothetical protein